MWALQKAGRLVAWWVWIGGLCIVAFGSRQLWRAFTIGKINARAVDFTRSASPVTFWFLVSLYLIMVALFASEMLLVAASEMGLISN
jgi:hypothetical protein